MYKDKNIIKILSSQVENEKKLLVTKTYQAKHFRRRNRINFQQWVSSTLKPLCNTLPEMKHIFAQLTPAHRKVFQMLMYMRAHGLPMYMSQEYIASKLGLHRTTVNRCIQTLKYYGFIDVYNRGEKQRSRFITNVYKVAAIFMKKHIWFEFMQTVPIFRSFMLSLIAFQPVLNPFPPSFFWATQRVDWRNATLLINKDNNLYISDSSYCKRRVQMSNDYYKKPIVRGEDYEDQPFPLREYGAPPEQTSYLPQKRTTYQQYGERKPTIAEELASKQRQLLNAQETNKHYNEHQERMARIESEKHTQAYKDNMEKARANLAKLGIGPHTKGFEQLFQDE